MSGASNERGLDIDRANAAAANEHGEDTDTANDPLLGEHEEFSANVEGVRPEATPELMEATEIVAKAVAAVRPSNGGASSWVPTYALGNRYAPGADCVSWHADHLSELGPRPVIAGLTLGAARPFGMRRAEQPGESVSVVLPYNSLAIMVDDAQEEWEHAVPRVSDSTITAHSKTGRVRCVQNRHQRLVLYFTHIVVFDPC